MLKDSWIKTAGFYTTIFSTFPPHERPHIDIEKNTPQDERVLVTAFIKNQYKIHEGVMRQEIKKIECAWKKKNKKIFDLAHGLFNDDQKSYDTYIAYPSIWPMNVRSVNKKQISFPCNQGINHALFVLSHELLHIFFYNHLYRKFKKLRSTISSKKVWAFSEVLNVLIQNEKAWIQLTGLRARPYPQHKRLYKQMNAYRKNNHTVDDMIIHFLCSPPM